mgnify:CR=1 FL=1
MTEAGGTMKVEGKEGSKNLAGSIPIITKHKTKDRTEVNSWNSDNSKRDWKRSMIIILCVQSG